MQIDEANYALVDNEGEKQYQCKLQASLARAKRGKALEGKSFYALSSAIKPDPAVLGRIIEASGGVFHKVTSATKLKKLAVNDPDMFILGTKQDGKIARQHLPPGRNVYDVEFLLLGLLRQSLDPNRNVLMTT